MAPLSPLIRFAGPTEIRASRCEARSDSVQTFGISQDLTMSSVKPSLDVPSAAMFLAEANAHRGDLLRHRGQVAEVPARRCSRQACRGVAAVQPVLEPLVLAELPAQLRQAAGTLADVSEPVLPRLGKCLLPRQ